MFGVTWRNGIRNEEVKRNGVLRDGWTSRSVLLRWLRHVERMEDRKLLERIMRSDVYGE